MDSSLIRQQFLDRLALYRDTSLRHLIECIPDREPKKYLYELVTVYPNRSGKGFRPSLCLSSCKIFGGSEITNAHGTFNIGERNIRLAQDMLGSEQIPIINHSVGGSLGRKAIFYTALGDVLISYIKNDISLIDQQSNNSGFNLSQK